MATKTAAKTVQVVARYELKANGHIVYRVKSSTGKDEYCTTVIDGHATGCSCPAHKPCYHMTQLERVEQQRTMKAVTPAYLPPLNGNRAFSFLR